MAQYRFERLRDEYARLWAGMRVVKGVEAARQARRVIAGKARYQAVEARTGVPWFVVGCLHMRESNGDFAAWLHNGDRMVRGGKPARTVNVPAGRPPDPAVTWEEGAYDALVVCERMNEITDWGPERVAYAAELFNGFGYRNPARDIPSPYLWGGTSVQKPGKFVRDGVYDAHAMDSQIGAMAVLKMTMEIDPEARFAAPRVVDDAPELIAEEREPAAAPKAQDCEAEAKPLTQSRTVQGAALSYAVTAWSAVQGFFQKLDNPYTLAAFVAILLAGAGALWLVISGRINVQKVVAHLSQDDTGAKP